mmetsp:Transcript_492/g.869  ORF Transcript_492/g.869 Transcript_492/m.869 type:complete len:277 (+) Transcript_492:786-1616(+)
MARASSFPVTPGDNVTTSPLRPCTLSNGVAATFNEGVSTSALAGGELPLGSGLFPRSCGGGRGRESCKGDTGREDGDSERRGDSAVAPGARASRGAAAARFPTQASSSSFRWVLGSILLAAGHSASPPTLALEQLGKALARRVRGEHGGVEGREAESSSRSGTEGVCRSVRAEDEEVETGVRIGQVASTDWFEGMMPPKGAGGGASASSSLPQGKKLRSTCAGEDVLGIDSVDCIPGGLRGGSCKSRLNSDGCTCPFSLVHTRSMASPRTPCALSP